MGTVFSQSRKLHVELSKTLMQELNQELLVRLITDLNLVLKPGRRRPSCSGKTLAALCPQPEDFPPASKETEEKVEIVFTSGPDHRSFSSPTPEAVGTVPNGKVYELCLYENPGP